MGKRPAKGATKSRSSTALSAERFAHPFFVPEPPAQREPFQGNTRLADWSKQNLGPIPPIARKGIMDLSEVIGDAGVQEIQDLGEIRFHALGDSGVGNAHEAEQISNEAATDYKPAAGGLNPAFLFHLGDVIYGNDKANHYGERFYSPYKRYPGKIIAIPGNHDGEVRAPADDPSLSAFLANFCVPIGTESVPAQALATGVYRKTMAQPGACWMLDAPFLRIVALYSNRIENFGYLEGKTKAGALDSSQIDWLRTTLSNIKKDNNKKALIVATHHPPYSSSGHNGSFETLNTIDKAFDDTGVTPDAFLSAHAHNYQRYTRKMKGKQVPYIVVGTGGMPVQRVVPATGQPGATPDVTYDAAVASLGYLYVTVSSKQIKFDFWQLGGDHNTAFDPFIVDLTDGTLKGG
jgi:Calcineurin-like phosphoesterase